MTFFILLRSDSSWIKMILLKYGHIILAYVILNASEESREKVR